MFAIEDSKIMIKLIETYGTDFHGVDFRFWFWYWFGWEIFGYVIVVFRGLMWIGFGHVFVYVCKDYKYLGCF